MLDPAHTSKRLLGLVTVALIFGMSCKARTDGRKGARAAASAMSASPSRHPPSAEQGSPSTQPPTAPADRPRDSTATGRPGNSDPMAIEERGAKRDAERQKRESALHKIYEVEMARGRRATSDGKWDEAIDAFTLAIGQPPDNGQASAERGYAYLLAHRLDEAQEDFKRAMYDADSLELVFQVLHNQALAFEASGDAERAERARQLRKRLRTFSRSARKKASCSPRLKSVRNHGGVMKDWRAVMAAVVARHEESAGKGSFPSPPSPAASNEELQRQLTGTSNPKDRAWLIDMQKVADGPTWHLVARRHNGELVLYLDIAKRYSTRCGAGPKSVTLGDFFAPMVVVRDTRSDPQKSCLDAQGKPTPCNGDRVASTTERCPGGSLNADKFLIFQEEHPIAFWSLQQEPDGDHPRRDVPPIEVLPNLDGEWVVGPGCKRVISI